MGGYRRYSYAWDCCGQNHTPDKMSCTYWYDVPDLLSDDDSSVDEVEQEPKEDIKPVTETVPDSVVDETESINFPWYYGESDYSAEEW